MGSTALFLPLLPKQILLNNILSDLPSMASATDRVDPELAAGPRRWDTRFMVVFGLVSSAFDFLTFGCCSSCCGRAPPNSAPPGS